MILARESPIIPLLAILIAMAGSPVGLVAIGFGLLKILLGSSRDNGRRRGPGT